MCFRKDTVKALLITGEGRFFSNGIDLAWLSNQKGDVPGQFINALSELFKRILVLPIPTAAIINGKYSGIGFSYLTFNFKYQGLVFI